MTVGRDLTVRTAAIKKLLYLLALLVSTAAVAVCTGEQPTPAAGAQAVVTQIAAPSPTPVAASSSVPGSIPIPTGSPVETASVSPGKVVSEEDIGPLLPPNGVALFGRISGASTSDTLRTTDRSTGQIRDMRIESSSYALVMVPVLPDRGEPIVIETYTSPSYAKNVARPSTRDDRLFIVRSWDGGSNDISEYDVDTLEALPGRAAVQFSPAVIDDAAYYYTYPSYDNFTGWRGQLEFVRESLTSGQETRTTVRSVQGYLNDPFFSRSLSLMSAGQDLYGLITPSSNDPSIVIVGVDRSTGEPTEIATYAVNGFDDYMRGSWEWVADNGSVYWLAVRSEEGETVAEIYWHELERRSVPQSVSVTLPEDVTGMYGFDVDDGYFVLEAWLQDRNRSGLILFDLSTGVIEMVDLGFEISDVQIIHLGE